MPDTPTTPLAADPTAEELAEILADLDFYQNMDDADALPLEDEDAGDEEKSHE